MRAVFFQTSSSARSGRRSPISLRSSAKVEQGRSDKAAAIFGIADEDLAVLAAGKAEVRDLYQRGKLRVDGEVRLARELGVLSGLA